MFEPFLSSRGFGQRVRGLLLVPAALGAVACGSSASSGPSADPSIAGWYAARSLIVSEQYLTGVDPYHAEASFFIAAEVVVENGRAFMDEHFCKSELKGGPVDVIVPDAFTRSYETPRVELEAQEVGGHVEYTHPPHPILGGARLKDPDKEPLPTTITDPRVWDQDGDGKPGLTVIVRLGDSLQEMYVVRRERFHFTLHETSPGRYEGPFVDNSEQVVLDATLPFLKVAPTGVNDLARSNYRMIKLESGSGCDAATPAWPMLDGPEPTPSAT